MVDLVFAGDNTSFISSIILKGLLKALKNRNDIRLVEVVSVRRSGVRYFMGKQNFIISCFRYGLIKMFNPEYKWDYHGDIEMMARKAQIPVRHELNGQKRCSLLSVAYPFRIIPSHFDYAVNYHNSLLPKYGGLHSTAFAVYFGEEESGYTFHRVAKSFDSGNILLQEKMPTFGCQDSRKIDYTQAVLASEKANEILDHIVNRTEGKPQQGERVYIGISEWRKLLTCQSDTPLQEVKRKIKLFGFVWMEYKGEIAYVTSVDENNQPNRICYLPRWLYGVVSKWI